MQSRAARLILLCFFLAAIATSAFLFWKGDAEASTAALQARTFDAASKTIERSLLDVRAGQRGYAAANQPGDRWIGKVAEGLESVRAGVQALRADVHVPEAQAALDVAAAALNEFAKSDKRAVEYVRNDQRQLASDVVFGDGLERSETALASLEQARVAELQAREAAVSIFRSRQVFALTAGAAAAVLAVLLLVPVAKAAPVVAVQLARAAEPRRPSPPARDLELDDEIVSVPRRIPDPEPTLASLTPADISASPVPEVEAEPEPERLRLRLAPTTDFAGVASLCADLARVVDTRALPSLLDRTALLLDASGIILWIADPDGRELNPIFAQGYPQQLVNRLGTIPRDAQNATAAAFRTSLLQTVMADEISGGAIAAPLVTPGGCVGVMAAEVRNDSEREAATLAAATIVAAQLATLVGPPSARPQARTASGA
jgi:CHASE3 domain sensor protein